MDQQEYVSLRGEIVNNFPGKIDIHSTDAIYNQFNLVSASLMNYLPHIAFGLHEEIFKNILLHQQLSILEQSSHSVLDYVTNEGLDNDVKNVLSKGPSIICTFHTGSYRLINLFLIRKKIPYTLVIARKTIEMQGVTFSDLYKLLPGSDMGNGFRVIDAESPSSGLQMLKELKRGRSLLVYIDGNSGAGRETFHNENRHAVNFLNQQIFARKGIAFLAHVANTPILTIASYRKSFEDIRLRFFPAIYPAGNQDRSVFAEQSTQLIYGQVSPIISEYPEQWEGWLYLHKVANIIRADHSPPEVRSSINRESLLFNSARFGTFRIGDTAFLFKKTNYTSYEIDNDLYSLLADSISQPVAKHKISSSLSDKLYREGVLICSS